MVQPNRDEIGAGGYGAGQELGQCPDDVEGGVDLATAVGRDHILELEAHQLTRLHPGQVEEHEGRHALVGEDRTSSVRLE